MITNIYQYPELKRVDKEIGRYYIDSKNQTVPSVTTVLGKTSDKSDSIQQWRNKVGDDEADRITKQSTDIGSMVHEALENFLNEKDWKNFSDDQNGIIANKITDANLKIISGAGHLINIENPKIFNHYILKFLKDLTKKKKYT